MSIAQDIIIAGRTIFEETSKETFNIIAKIIMVLQQIYMILIFISEYPILVIYICKILQICCK